MMDRLSELPGSLILHILGLLPTNDVVRTMVLSKQWKTLWTTTTCLTFNDSINTDRFRSFVDRVLASWKGCKIEKFRVTTIFGHDERDINAWVRWALGRGVEDLYLDLLHYPVDDVKQVVLWSPPQSLYSCSSLHRLFIFGCNLRINENVDVEWRNLKELHMEGCGFTQAVINQVLGGSPKLDQLALTLFQSNEASLSIQSTSLRYLLLHKYMVPSLDSELRICAPNLETLKLYGFPNYRCLVMKVVSLTAAALRSCTGDFIGETLVQILPSIQYVDDHRSLPECFVMAIGAVELKNMLANANVKLLKLNNKGYEEIARLLANVPKLETLVLQPVVEYSPISSRKPRAVEETERSLEFTNLPYSSLHHLSRVEVTWTHDDSIFEILMECVSMRRKLVFRLPNTKLLGMLPTAQRIGYQFTSQPTKQSRITVCVALRCKYLSKLNMHAENHQPNLGRQLASPFRPSIRNFNSAKANAAPRKPGSSLRAG